MYVNASVLVVLFNNGGLLLFPDPGLTVFAASRGPESCSKSSSGAQVVAERNRSTAKTNKAQEHCHFL